MTCQITNNSNLEIEGFEDMVQSLVLFSQDRFGFEKPPSLFLNSDINNASNILGKTAYYDPQTQEIHIYVDERHPKDIMRSISHELIHHKQNLDGELNGDYYHGEGYAQKDSHMRKMEKQAYLNGNMCFRDWEDGYKQNETIYNEWRNKQMSLKEWKNKELFGLLSKKWGFGKNTITEEKEITHMCALKVTHKESGQVGHPIKHTLTESGDISHYTVEFNKVIVENIAVENLDIMVQEEHTHKRDDEKPHSEEKPVVNEKELEEADVDPLDKIVKQIRWYVEYDIEALKDFLSTSCADLSEDNFNGLSERINQLSEEVNEQQFASINEIMTELKEAAKPDFLDLDGDGDKEEPMKDAAKDLKEGEEELELQVGTPGGEDGTTMADISEDAELDESVERDLMQAIRALAADRAGTPEEDLKAAIKIMVDREMRRANPEYQKKLKNYSASKKGPQLEEETELEETAAKREGNEDRDVGRDRMHADRMHETKGSLLKKMIRTQVRKMLKDGK